MTKNLTAYLQGATETGQIHGGELLVLKGGEAIYHQAFGRRDEIRKMETGQVYRLASITKPLTSAAVLSAFAGGQLEPGMPVTDLLPEFRPVLPDGRVPVITLGHLLTHTAGLSYAFLEPRDSAHWQTRVSTGLDQPGLSLEENLARLAAAPLLFEPGTAWHYSLATDVIGAVLEQLHGQPLETVLRRVVLDPLGMSETSFAAPMDRDGIVPPYWDGDGIAQPMNAEEQLVPFVEGVTYAPGRIFDAASYHSGGAGIRGSARDIATFLECIRTGGAPILPTREAKLMHTNMIGDIPVATDGPGWGFGYGAAVLRDPVAADTPHRTGTFQWGGAWGHHWFVDPEEELVSVQLTNTALRGMTGDFPNGVIREVYAAFTS
ncbi:MAG: serine hydrolase domain-containing protein [Sulfitobacter dubius]